MTGTITRPARALRGVLTVLSHENAPRLVSVDDAELAVFQSDAVAYRGQFVAVVVAETLEVARHAAELVAISYEEQSHDVELRADRGDLYPPQRLNGNFETDTISGDVEGALASAAVTLDRTYTTPACHNNPLEPHATTATWSDNGVTLYDVNQGAHWIRDTVAAAFGLPPERVRVLAPYVGGAFGSKAFTHPHVILTVMAARVVGRPVKLALTRQQMFAVAGYRTPTIQRIRLGADRDGRLTAIACGLDPIEFRIRNEPAVDPETGRPFSSRGLVACLREGAQRFGWAQRDPVPRTRRDGRWLVGTGVASATRPVRRLPATAVVRVSRDGHHRVRIDASDIGTGAWTVLAQIAADVLEVPLECVQLEIGGSVPAEGLEATGTPGETPDAQRFAMNAFGAHFAEVRVDVDSGKVRVPRLLGVFAAGRIVNPKTARSQFLGGMTMGLSMALHEEDPHVNPLGAKGVGEIGIVGTAAAIANAVHHATGIRIRDLPVTLDKLLG